MDPLRARRELRVSVGGFCYILDQVREHTVFKRATGKQEQAPVQLQLEVFLYSLQSYSYHAIAQHFGVGEGKH